MNFNLSGELSNSLFGVKSEALVVNNLAFRVRNAMEQIFTYHLPFNNFLYQLLGFFAVLCLIGAVIPFSFHYKKSEISNYILVYGGFFLVGLVGIIIVIAKAKSNRSSANAHKVRLTNTVLEFPKGKSYLITLPYQDITETQLFEDKFRGDVLAVKTIKKTTIYIDSKGFESPDKFKQFHSSLKNHIQ